MTVAEKTYQPLCFSIAGESITRLARDFVLEGRWTDAVTLLHEGIEGPTLNQHLSVLEGDFTFIGHSPRTPGGESTLDIAPEDPEITEDYKESVAFMYAGIYKVGSRFYRPYAVVNNYGINDLEACDNIPLRTINGQAANMLLTQARGLHYANNRTTDRAAYMEYLFRPDMKKRSGTVLWQIVDIPPFWLRTFSYLEEALEDYLLKGQRLDERGHHQYYREDITQSEKWNTHKKKSPEEIEADKILLEKDKEEEAQRELKYQQELVNIRKKVLKQALETETGFMYLTIKGKRVRIPRAPFERWALRGTKFQHLAPPWEPVAGSGWKMQNDDADHTDWFIAAKFNMDTPYQLEEDVQSAIDDKITEVQKRLLNFDCAVLCGSGWTTGEVVHPKPDETVPVGSIIVIPAASEDYVIPALSACADGAGAIVTEAGGKMAHLAVLGLEKGFRLVRMKDARKKYPVGSQISISCDKGTIKGLRFYE